MTTQSGGTVESSSWKRDPDKDSPLRHEAGSYITWDNLATLKRAIESYQWSLVVASRSGADVEAERKRVAQFGDWLYRLSHAEPGHECHASRLCRWNLRSRGLHGGECMTTAQLGRPS